MELITNIFLKIVEDFNNAEAEIKLGVLALALAFLIFKPVLFLGFAAGVVAAKLLTFKKLN